MNISISESGSVSMSMNIDFRLYAKFRNEQICTDTLSKITVIYDEDEECSLLDIAKAFRTSELMKLLSKHDPMVYAFDTVTAPEGESFCFVHNVYGSEQEALLALAVFGRAIIELAEDDVALIIDMTDYDNEYFGNHIMYYLGGELDEVKQYTVRGVAGSSHHGIEISDFNKMLRGADITPAQQRYLKEIAPEPHPTDLMDSHKWWSKKKHFGAHINNTYDDEYDNDDEDINDEDYDSNYDDVYNAVFDKPFIKPTYKRPKTLQIGTISVKVPDHMNYITKSELNGECSSMDELRSNYECVIASDDYDDSLVRHKDVPFGLNIDVSAKSELPEIWNAGKDKAKMALTNFVKQIGLTYHGKENPVSVVKQDDEFMILFSKGRESDDTKNYWISYFAVIAYGTLTYSCNIFINSKKGTKKNYEEAVKEFLEKITPVSGKKKNEYEQQKSREKLGAFAGENGKIDAFKVALLYSEDVIFNNDDEIVEEDDKKVMTGLQVNADSPYADAMIQQIDNISAEIKQLSVFLENNKKLRIPEQKVDPEILKAAKNMPLSGLSVFELMAWHMIKLSALEENKYLAIVDCNLIKGIPEFYGYLGEIIKTFRKYNSIKGDFDVLAVSCINMDSPIENDVEAPVNGADEYHSVYLFGIKEKIDSVKNGVSESELSLDDFGFGEVDFENSEEVIRSLISEYERSKKLFDDGDGNATGETTEYNMPDEPKSELELEARRKAQLKRGFDALEDGEWDEADDFFEAVLNYDAECAEAYLGKFLADNNAHSLQSFKDKNVALARKEINKIILSKDKTSGKKNKTVTACEVDNAFINDVIKRFAVEKGEEELKADNIRRRFEFDRTYTSCLERIKSYKDTFTKDIDKDRNLTKAIRYGNDKIKDDIDQFKKSFAELFEKYISDEKEKDSNKQAEISDGYRKHLEMVSSDIQAIHDNFIEKQSSTYSRLKEKTDAIINGKETYIESVAVNTINELKGLNGYEDSDALAEKLDEEIKYEKAKSTFVSSSRIEQYIVARDLFQKVEQYKDSPEYISKCDSAITEIKSKKEEEYKAEQDRIRKHKRKKKVVVFVVLFSIIAVVAAIIIYARVIYPSNKYEHGLTALENGEYDEAIKTFEELNDYKDSVDMVKESKYQKAMYRLENKDYDAAIKMFTELDDYSDSDMMAKESKYQKATDLFEDGQIFDAYILFGKIEPYKESSTMRKTLNDSIVSEFESLISESEYEEVKQIIKQYSLEDIYTEDYVDFLEGKKYFEEAVVIDDKIEIDVGKLEKAEVKFSRNDYYEAGKYYDASRLMLKLEKECVSKDDISELVDINNIPQCKEVLNKIYEVIDSFKGSIYSNKRDDARYYNEIKDFSYDGTVTRENYYLDYGKNEYTRSKSESHMVFIMSNGKLKLEGLDTDDWQADGMIYYDSVDCFLTDLYAEYNEIVDYAACKRIN